MSKSSVTPRKAILLAPGQGRAYSMGRISAVFKADEDETQSRYSVVNGGLSQELRGPQLTRTPKMIFSMSSKA
jgi:hypothetical protein